jgi:ABC-type sugar transport system substrate-binding protein
MFSLIALLLLLAGLAACAPVATQQAEPLPEQMATAVVTEAAPEEAAPEEMATEAAPEEEAAEEAGEEAATTEETAAGSEEPVRVGFVVHVTGIEFTAIVEEGAQDAARDHNVELTFTGPPNVDHPAQIAAFDSLLETDLDGIVFIAGDPSVWTEPVQRAVDRGVIVLTADADAPDTARTAFFGVDARGLGELLGQEVRKLVGDEGKIVLGECVIGPEPHVLREEGFRSAFEGASVEFAGPYETVCDATQNYSNWQNAYTANQDAAAFVGLTAVETPSLGKLKEETGGDFIVGSFDPGAEGLRQMMNGNIDVTVGQNPYLAGYLPVQAIARAVREGRTIEPGLHLYPGEHILPADAEALLEREGGGQPRTDWYKTFMADNNLADFGLAQ